LLRWRARVITSSHGAESTGIGWRGAAWRELAGAQHLLDGPCRRSLSCSMTP